MINKEDTYYIGYHSTVREIGAVPALVFNTIAGLLRTTDGIGKVSNTTLCDFLGLTPQWIRKTINQLIEAGYLEKETGDGRGNISIYYITEKGKQNCPFELKKGETKFLKRGNKISIKGKQNCPINTGYNTGIIQGGSACAGAGAPAPTSPPPTTQKDFLEFWNLFCPDTSHDHDKENCYAVWQSMHADSRENLLKDLRAGRRYKKTDNPYWYLKDWQDPLPFMRQGTPEFGTWLDNARADGKCILLLKYPVDPNVPLEQAPLAYCYAENKDRMLNAGAVLLGIFANK